MEVCNLRLPIPWIWAEIGEPMRENLSGSAIRAAVCVLAVMLCGAPLMGADCNAPDQNFRVAMLQGRVFDQQLRPVAGAEVTVVKVDSPDPASLSTLTARTDAEGRYSFPSLDRNRYVIRIKAADLETADNHVWVEGKSHGDEVLATWLASAGDCHQKWELQTPNATNFDLPIYQRLSGQLHDPSGQAVAHARIVLEHNGVPREFKTDNTGRYNLGEWDAGQYRVWMDDKKWQRPTVSCTPTGCQINSTLMPR